MDTRIRPSSAHSRIRPPKRRAKEPTAADVEQSTEEAAPSDQAGPRVDKESDTGDSSGLLLLSIISAVFLALSCYWLFVPYGVQPIDGGRVTVNWTLSSLERNANRIDDRLTLYPAEAGYPSQPWVEVPAGSISLGARSAKCLRPSNPEKTAEGWRIVLHPREGCENAALVLKMPEAHTKGRHFRSWVQFAWYTVEQRAVSVDKKQPLRIKATFRAPNATAKLTREVENLVYSAYSSAVSSSEYRCDAINTSADVSNAVTCSTEIPGEENWGNVYEVRLPGWSYRFETPSYPALAVALPSFLGAVFGASISGLPPFVPWRSAKKRAQ